MRALAYIHKTAVVHKSAIIHPGAIIGPNVFIEADAVIGSYSCLGGMPEHRDFYSDINQEKTLGVRVGAGARIFEHVTIHAGTVRETYVGTGSAIFNHSHIAHDCHIEEYVTIGGHCCLAGHTTVMERANVSGKSCSAHKVIIGALSFISGASYVTSNIPPAQRWAGFPPRLIGLNEVGMQRAGLTYDDVLKIYGERYMKLIKGDK